MYIDRLDNISDLKGKETVGTFCKKELKKTNQKEFIVEKVIKKKGDKLYVKWKDYDSSFNSWVDKIGIVKMSECFLEPKSSGGRVKFELDLSNYTTKVSKSTRKFDLANLKSNVANLDIYMLKNLPTNLSNFKNKAGQLDVDKLVPVPVDLNKLNSKVKDDVVKNDLS